MLSAQKHDSRTRELARRLRCAPALTPDLMSDVISHACARLPALNATAKTKVSRLIDIGASTDAALALLDFELPQWKVRRLVCEDGAWLCSLSKQSWIPIDLDDLAEASHESLSIAILLALLEAQSATSSSTPVTLPSIRPTPGYAMCCDNFA